MPVAPCACDRSLDPRDQRTRGLPLHPALESIEASRSSRGPGGSVANGCAGHQKRGYTVEQGADRLPNLGKTPVPGLVVAAHQTRYIIGGGGRDGLAARVSLCLSVRGVESVFPYEQEREHTPTRSPLMEDSGLTPVISPQPNRSPS